MVMCMLGMMKLSCRGEYISNIHLWLSNQVVYHVYTTRRPFDVSVSYCICMCIYIYIIKLNYNDYPFKYVQVYVCVYLYNNMYDF